MEKIRIGIMGYGNLGKGAHLAAAQNPDMTVAGIFTRRDPSAVAPVLPAPVYAEREAERLRGDIDVLLLCGGSATDLPEQGPRYAALFNTVDSFDTHADIPAYFEAVDKAAKAGGNAALISVGWDPGLFSLNRAYAQSVLPDGADYTFWGRGVSQGHSDAARRDAGAEYAAEAHAALLRRRRAGRGQSAHRARNQGNDQILRRIRHDRRLYHGRGDGARPFGPAARRVCHPQRAHRCAARERACDRIFA